MISCARFSASGPGLGLIEQIPAADILAHADPDDKDHDGISGRPNYGKDLVTGKIEKVTVELR